MTDAPRPGDIWEYPYLWAWQDARGESEGRKDRPVTVAVTLERRDGFRRVYLLAITTQPPAPGRAAVEMPETEKKRAGLSADKRLWVMLDEYNFDIVGRSFHLDPEARIGHIGEKFLRQVQHAFRAAVARGGAQSVRRTDD